MARAPRSLCYKKLLSVLSAYTLNALIPILHTVVVIVAAIVAAVVVVVAAEVEGGSAMCWLPLLKIQLDHKVG